MYVAVADLQRLFGRDPDVEEPDADDLAQAIAAACLAVDRQAGYDPDPARLVFAPAGDTATARTYTVGGIDRVTVDPFVGTPTVETSDDHITWNAADTVWATPANATVHTGIESTRPLGRWAKVTARWGWPDTPPDIAQATLIHAARLFKRRDSVTGVEGGTSFAGPIRVSLYLDPDVERLISPYQRHHIA